MASKSKNKNRKKKTDITQGRDESDAHDMVQSTMLYTLPPPLQDSVFVTPGTELRLKESAGAGPSIVPSSRLAKDILFSSGIGETSSNPDASPYSRQRNNGTPEEMFTKLFERVEQFKQMVSDKNFRESDEAVGEVEVSLHDVLQMCVDQTKSLLQLKEIIAQQKERLERMIHSSMRIESLVAIDSTSRPVNAIQCVDDMEGHVAGCAVALIGCKEYRSSGRDTRPSLTVHGSVGQHDLRSVEPSRYTVDHISLGIKNVRTMPESRTSELSFAKDILKPQNTFPTCPVCKIVLNFNEEMNLRHVNSHFGK